MNATNAPTPIDLSIAAYRLILDDIAKTYPNVGGGGISAIRQTETQIYVATISQEGRSDTITYTMKTAKDGSVAIAKRAEGTISRH